jgi:hypothetical protein
MSNCIFCKSPLQENGRAKEHIFPDWLLREWNLSKAPIQPTHLSPEGNIISQRNHVFDSLQAGHVCLKCNNGWMSELEVQAKDLLIDLALGKRSVLKISDEEALLLGRWTCKTAYSLHSSANWRRIVPDNHISILDSDNYRLPENVFVVGHNYKRSKDISWSQSTTWPIYLQDDESKDSVADAAKDKAYKIALRIGGLFLMVFFIPIPNTRACLWKFRHVPLYPRTSHPVAWYSKDREWPKNPERRFLEFVYSLSIAVEGSQARMES